MFEQLVPPLAQGRDVGDDDEGALGDGLDDAHADDGFAGAAGEDQHAGATGGTPILVEDAHGLALILAQGEVFPGKRRLAQVDLDWLAILVAGQILDGKLALDQGLFKEATTGFIDLDACLAQFFLK